jgi:hypothetical protein
MSRLVFHVIFLSIAGYGGHLSALDCGLGDCRPIT